MFRHKYTIFKAHTMPCLKPILATQLLQTVQPCNSLLFISGNKTSTRCNRGFYCRSYCLLNMFRATLCPSSGAEVVAACGIWCCGFRVAGLVWSWGLCVRFAGCCVVELRVMCPVFRMLLCGAESYVSGLQDVVVWSWGLCVRFAGCCGVELRVMCPVCRMLWCGAESYVSGLQDVVVWSWGLCVRFAGCCGVELRVMCPVCRMLWCGAEGYVSCLQDVVVWSWELCVRFAGCYGVELRVMCPVCRMLWCGADSYVSGLQGVVVWSWGLCVRFSGCCSILKTGHITLSSTKPTVGCSANGRRIIIFFGCNTTCFGLNAKSRRQ